jgi:hypothetical protein
MPSDAAPTPAESERKAYSTLGRSASAMRGFVLLCRHNSDHCGADAKERLTPFHSVAEPPIGLPAYVARIMKHTECGEDGVMLGLRLAGRYCRKAKMMPSVLCAHRLVLVSIVLAVKTHYDKFRSNRTAGKSGGLRIQELNLLEAAMYRGLKYQTMIFQVEVDNLSEGAEHALMILSETPMPPPQPPASSGAAPLSPALPEEVVAWFRNAFDGILGSHDEPNPQRIIEEFVEECAAQQKELRAFVAKDLDMQRLAEKTGEAPQTVRLNAQHLGIVAGSGLFAVRSRIAQNQADDTHSVATSAVNSATSQQAAAIRFRSRVLSVWTHDDEAGTQSNQGSEYAANSEAHSGVPSKSPSKEGEGSKDVARKPAPPVEASAGRPSANRE